MACTTPKSPQPGHQMGFKSLLKSLTVQLGRAGCRVSTVARFIVAPGVASARLALRPRRHAARSPLNGDGRDWRRCGRKNAAPAEDRVTCAGCDRAAPGTIARP